MQLPTPRPSTREAHEKAVARVISAMQGDPDAAMSLRDMARVAFMSRYHFDRTFRVVTGVRPRHYLRALRLQAAKRLLVTTSASVTDVCLDVGYNSLGTFIRCFTELLGVSPLRLRSLARRNEPAVPVDAHTNPGVAPSVGGRVVAAPEFEGTIFVGLFATAIPQGLPIACAIAARDGRFTLARVPDGDYYLFALGVSRGAAPRDLILCDSAVRAGSLPVRVVGGSGTVSSELILRPPSPLDPPMLVAIPALIERYRRAGRRGISASVPRVQAAACNDDGARRRRRDGTSSVVTQNL